MLAFCVPLYMHSPVTHEVVAIFTHCLHQRDCWMPPRIYSFKVKQYVWLGVESCDFLNTIAEEKK